MQALECMVHRQVMVLQPLQMKNKSNRQPSRFPLSLMPINSETKDKTDIKQQGNYR